MSPAGDYRDSESSVGDPRPRATSWLETAVVVHVGTMLVFTAWAFGGNIAWAQNAITGWGVLAALFLVLWLFERRRHHQTLRLLHCLWPLVGLNLMVVASHFNPSFGEIRMDGEIMAFRAHEFPHLPSSAQPAQSLRVLLLFDAIFVSCFNLALIVRRRALLRNLLAVVAANAFVLSVFGTVQHLLKFEGLFFGSVPSPQPYYFASFVYHNHWGAFIILMVGLCIGLTWDRSAVLRGRDMLHSPLLAGIVVIFFIAVTVPLSGSRSCSIVLLGLLATTLIHLLLTIVAQRQAQQKSVIPLIFGVVAFSIGAVSYGLNLAQPMLAKRYEATRVQLRAAYYGGILGSRPTVYRDTLKMAGAKPFFGWGMYSFPLVFQLYNTSNGLEPDTGRNRRQNYYHDAHSDWLQSLAEHGIVGTLLLVLCAMAPLHIFRRSAFGGPLPLYQLAACGAVVFYSAAEFPFGNTAVVLSWWFLFFSALGYARLSSGSESI